MSEDPHASDPAEPADPQLAVGDAADTDTGTAPVLGEGVDVPVADVPAAGGGVGEVAGGDGTRDPVDGDGDDDDLPDALGGTGGSTAGGAG